MAKGSYYCRCGAAYEFDAATETVIAELLDIVKKQHQKPGCDVTNKARAAKARQKHDAPPPEEE